MMKSAIKFLILFCISLHNSAFGSQHQVPVLDLPPNVHSVYEGTIDENGNVVTVVPEIRIVNGTGPVCGYVITALEPRIIEKIHPASLNGSRFEDSSLDEEDENSDSDEYGDEDQMEYEQSSKIPFGVDVMDKWTGMASIRYIGKGQLDCKDIEYMFRIIPQSCNENGEIAKSGLVRIRVMDTNNHHPIFHENSMTIDVEEGRVYNNLTSLQALDDDCGYPFGEICQYQIQNGPSGVFKVTKSGILKNLQPLSYHDQSQHVLLIVAEDCGMRKSKPIKVVIRVKPTCVLGFKNIHNHIEYVAEDAVKILVPSIQADYCTENCSSVENIQGKVILEKLDGKEETQCDMEYYTAEKLKNDCGADVWTVDLLSQGGKVTNNSTHAKRKPDHHEYHLASHSFDGEKDAIVVPSETVNSHIPDKFTLSFWMKHGHPKMVTKAPGVKTHSLKENIVCSSDDHRFNRHHFAIYVRNCKLELLLRRENPNQKGDTEFQPAEWRWKLSETCDQKWHHYSINMNFPQLDLFIDGKPVKHMESNLEVLDDWPLHKVNGIKTKLVIGACWHGGGARMTQFFHGSLAEVIYLPNKTQSQTVLDCLLQCKEQLEFGTLKHLKSGQEVLFNRDLSQISLKANRMTDYLEMLQTVGYSNHKTYPTPGQRLITISTSFSCKGKNSKILEIPIKKIYVDVKKSTDPKILLDGDGKIEHGEQELNEGVNIFNSMRIRVQGDKENQATLDYCRIRTKPKLVKNKEYFSYPAASVTTLKIKFKHIRNGVALKGIQTAKNYEEALHQVRYFNNPSYRKDFKDKTFNIVCVASNGHVKSNEFAVQMKVMERRLMGELKSDMGNQLGISERMEKDEKIGPPTSMTDTTPMASKTSTTNATAQGLKIISDSGQESGITTVKANGENRTTLGENELSKEETVSVLEREMDNVPALLMQEQLEHGGHLLTLDKLAADVPRPSLGGPLPLMHRADIEETYGTSAMTGSSSAVAIVIVVCVGFLVLLVVIGVIKIRSTHRRMLAHRQKHRRHRRPSSSVGEMENGTTNNELTWDDGGINITVNPIEEIGQTSNQNMCDDEYSEASMEEDDDMSYIDEQECSDEEDPEKVLPHVSSSQRDRSLSQDSETGAGPTGGLEWDDSTLLQSATQPNVRSQTYRV